MAETCFRFELGISDNPSSAAVAPNEEHFIRARARDSVHKELLSGESLYLDLKRMEAAFYERNRREFELTKHISLAMLNPLALIQLKETGKCSFDLSETLFDMDYAGHYMRRIKAISLTIPC